MTYPKLPGLTWDGTIYENEEMGTLEALLPTGGYPTAHAPAMAELPNGDLLCCWFAGTYEGSADIHIICSPPSQGRFCMASAGGDFRRSYPQRAEPVAFLRS